MIFLILLSAYFGRELSVTWSNTLQGQHIVMAHLDDINFRVGTPSSFPSSSGHRSEHDHLLLYNWSLDPEICHNMILVLE